MRLYESDCIQIGVGWFVFFGVYVWYGLSNFSGVMTCTYRLRDYKVFIHGREFRRGRYRFTLRGLWYLFFPPADSWTFSVPVIADTGS